MIIKTQYYTTTSRGFLIKARRHLAEGDLLQASEKGWGAAAQMVKSVAEARGWPHDAHHHLWGTINRLAKETGDTDIRALFTLASALHTNFYEDWMPVEHVADNLGHVENLLLKLKTFNQTSGFHE
ncbi:MAG: PaREP1 family protein [bacterium]|nr:PaREP1 family protein [bacterium]